VKTRYHKSVSHFHRFFFLFDIPFNTRLSLPIAALTSGDLYIVFHGRSQICVAQNGLDDLIRHAQVIQVGTQTAPDLGEKSGIHATRSFSSSTWVPALVAINIGRVRPISGPRSKEEINPEEVKKLKA
jgi:hypothetical protein